MKLLYLVIVKKYNRPDANDNYLEKIELSYLYNMFNIFRDIENCPGHIIELGVGAGRNAIILGNLLKTTGQNGSSRYFGFDSFKSYTARDLQIEKGLNPEKWKNNSYDFVSNRIKKHKLDDVSFLIEGDIRKTLPEFVASRVSKKSPDTLFCRLIYIDTSAYEPSILGLDLLWKHIDILFSMNGPWLFEETIITAINLENKIPNEFIHKSEFFIFF